jgi:hypothetical protein
LMLLMFDGWFQCRLATDPDPADEPRGVSGYMRALPGEPDLDRVIRLQPPFFRRSHTPEIGVSVREVRNDRGEVGGHPLVGAEVELLGKAIFKGENGIVAEDGKEPIVPFVVRVKSGNLALTRRPRKSPEYDEFPYEGLQPAGIVLAPGLVADATGVFDARRYLNERIAALEQGKMVEEDPTLCDNMERRIEFLKSPTALRASNFIAPYFVNLGGDGWVEDPEGRLPDGVDMDQPWTIDFWMGGWDPDAACGFMRGYLAIPEK